MTCIYFLYCSHALPRCKNYILKPFLVCRFLGSISRSLAFSVSWLLCTLPKNRHKLLFSFASEKLLKQKQERPAKTYFCIALLGFLNVFCVYPYKKQRATSHACKRFICYFFDYVCIYYPAFSEKSQLLFVAVGKVFVLIYDFKTSVDTGFYNLM